MPFLLNRNIIFICCAMFVIVIIAYFIKNYRSLAEQNVKNQEVIAEQVANIDAQNQVINKQSKVMTSNAKIVKNDTILNQNIVQYNSFEDRKKIFASIINGINCNVDNFENENIVCQQNS